MSREDDLRTGDVRDPSIRCFPEYIGYFDAAGFPKLNRFYIRTMPRNAAVKDVNKREDRPSTVQRDPMCPRVTAN